MKRRNLLQAIGLTVLGTSAHRGYAQTSWPSRPIRLIVPTPAGSATDIFARLVGSDLEKKLGQPFIIDNRTGANGRIATGAALSSAPDGHTLLLSYASAIVGARVLFPKDKNDASKLQPVSRFGSQGAIITVSPDVPARNIKEFASWVKSNREPVNYASYGIGSGGHIVMEALIKSLGIRMNHVPYKDGGQIISDMRSGLVKVSALDAVSPISYLKNQQLFALGVNGQYRLPATPEIPTLAEQGYPIYMASWYGLFAPGGAPQGIVKRLNSEMASIVEMPSMIERLKQMNLSSTPSISPQEFEKYILSEIKVWGDVVAASDIRLE